MSIFAPEPSKKSPQMIALPGPHYRNNPHPKADFLLWKNPRKQWPMKQAEKIDAAPVETGANAQLRKEELVAHAKAIKEAYSGGVFHKGAVFYQPNANRGRHWSIHPEWPIDA